MKGGAIAKWGGGEYRPWRETDQAGEKEEEKKKSICFLLVIGIVSADSHFSRIVLTKREKN